jgi:hypothetical protein
MSSMTVQPTIREAGAKVPADPDETPHACTDGFVFFGHMAHDPETGEELEAFEGVPCRRCSESGAEVAGDVR